MEQTDVVDAFVEIVRRDTSFPLSSMELVVTVFAETLGLEPKELVRIIGARDRELYGEATPYTGEKADRGLAL
ncbi:hypothetical protein LCGC14_2428900 [marine sediment metagenome]|uniref:Uncharacterized protein n=1 Tax=marine sediment metagenome TaxID=412755 RepID=A0A0F9BMK1_9ZZZZ